MFEARYMRKAFEEALNGIKSEEGGPFGAVIVQDGKIVGKGHNTVLKDLDPTAHAEINAIREAANKLGLVHLKNAVLYTTCEPCPMCLSAIYWARIPTVFYSMDHFDADRMGFSDSYIYKEILKPLEKRKIEMTKFNSPDITNLLKVWESKKEDLSY